MCGTDSFHQDGPCRPLEKKVADEMDDISQLVCDIADIACKRQPKIKADPSIVPYLAYSNDRMREHIEQLSKTASKGK